jgi:DNA-binding winged helix-turn-helix (wHTH) protein
MTKKTRGTLEFGPYRLESGPYRLWRGSQEIALRPKGLKVLAYLARHPGRLVTKNELREQVWGATPVSDTRIGHGARGPGGVAGRPG